MRTCDYCGRVEETYPVFDDRSGVRVLSEYCEKCLAELMGMEPEQYSDPIQDYANSDEYKESMMK